MRNRSTSLTFHPAVRASHQRSLSRSLSIIAPHSTAPAHSNAYVPSQRASHPSTHSTATAKPSTAQSSIHRASLTGFDGSSYKIVVVGAPQSGKTSLLHRLIAEQFEDGYRPTQRIELALYLLKDELFNSLEVRLHTRLAGLRCSLHEAHMSVSCTDSYHCVAVWLC